MSEKSSHLNPLIVVSVLGLAGLAGYSAGYLLADRGLSSEQVLRHVINTFEANGEIIGTWIHKHPEKYPYQDSILRVYHGGFRQQVGYEILSYEFFVDRRTGTVVELQLTDSTEAK